jgi:hypothetical protein
MQCMLGGSCLECALLPQATRHVHKIICKVDASVELVGAQQVTNVSILPETRSATAVGQPQESTHINRIGCRIDWSHH